MFPVFVGMPSVSVFKLHAVDLLWKHWLELRGTGKENLRKAGFIKLILRFLHQIWVRTQLSTSLFGYILFTRGIVISSLVNDFFFYAYEVS